MNHNSSIKHQLISREYWVVFCMVTTLFAFWGFANNITNPMVSAFKSILLVGNFESSLVQFAFYGGYCFMAASAAILVAKTSYKSGILLGLALYSLGCFLLVPAANAQEFKLFLVAFFVMTCGLSFLETSANPYILSLGHPSTATRRLNLAQAFAPSGSLCGILVAQHAILAKLSSASKQERQSRTSLIGPLKRLAANKSYLEGIVAQAFYLGTQIMCWTFLILYAENELGMSKAAAQGYCIAAMLLFVRSHFLCAYLLKFVSPGKLLLALATGGAALILGVDFLGAMLGLYCLVGVSGCLSLMFPTIDGIALDGLGDDSKLGAAGLILAIGGGSLMPPLQGAIVDLDLSGALSSTRLSFLLSLLCFVAIAVYGYRSFRRAGCSTTYQYGVLAAAFPSPLKPFENFPTMPSLRHPLSWRASSALAALLCLNAAEAAPMQNDERIEELKRLESDRILRKAQGYLEADIVTVTSESSPRSAGGQHDFYSEGDYWWPDPEHPEGPYIRRDGLTNPHNFVAHRKAMVRFSDIVAATTSAYLLTGDPKYSAKAREHIHAWLVDGDTRMNPSLLYGQAITGVCEGRSIGIIDTIHLVEVARAVERLEQASVFPSDELIAIKSWFSQYLSWLNEHPYGRTEREHPNNHGVCWSMQAAAFARLTGNDEVLQWIRRQFKQVYLAEMMVEDGSFPAELARTKPYGYSLFVLDAMGTVATLASTEEEDLWRFALPEGRSMERGIQFISPYVADKSAWPLDPDVLYWDEWPSRHPALIFATYRLDRPELKRLWQDKQPDPTTFEILRNLPVRHPVLWTDVLLQAPPVEIPSPTGQRSNTWP